MSVTCLGLNTRDNIGEGMWFWGFIGAGVRVQGLRGVGSGFRVFGV